MRLGTDDFDIVTFANAVVPLWPLAVNLIVVEVDTTLDIVASLVIEAVQPVPQPIGVEDCTLNMTVAGCDNDPLVPVTVGALMPAVG